MRYCGCAGHIIRARGVRAPPAGAGSPRRAPDPGRELVGVSLQCPGGTVHPGRVHPAHEVVHGHVERGGQLAQVVEGGLARALLEVGDRGGRQARCRSELGLAHAAKPRARGAQPHLEDVARRWFIHGIAEYVYVYCLTRICPLKSRHGLRQAHGDATRCDTPGGLRPPGTGRTGEQARPPERSRPCPVAG